jgi:hypothetical protein
MASDLGPGVSHHGLGKTAEVVGLTSLGMRHLIIELGFCGMGKFKASEKYDEL